MAFQTWTQQYQRRWSLPASDSPWRYRTRNNMPHPTPIHATMPGFSIPDHSETQTDGTSTSRAGHGHVQGAMCGPVENAEGKSGTDATGRSRRVPGDYHHCVPLGASAHRTQARQVPNTGQSVRTQDSPVCTCRELITSFLWFRYCKNIVTCDTSFRHGDGSNTTNPAATVTVTSDPRQSGFCME